MKFERLSMYILASALFFFSVTGCDNGSTTQESAIQQGKIIRTAIQGIAYATETQSGTTGVDGEFNYLAGETVTFSLGGTVLGTTVAKKEINWFELVGLDTIPTSYADMQQVFYSETGQPSLSLLGAVASILVTVDEDRDATNGIVISPEVAALFDDLEIDVSYVSSPRYDGVFKRLLRHAHRDGLLPIRRPRNGSYALDTVYENHGVQPSVFVATRVENDTNADGQSNWIRRLTYSDLGRVIGDYIDSDGDGNPEILVSLSYDEEGHGMVYAHDNNADGVVDRSRTWVLDGFGDVERYETDNDGDQLPELVETRVTNENGLWVRREVVNNATGGHTVEVWNTDAVGNRTSYDLDRDGDGTYDTLVVMTYDEALGPWVTRNQDDGRDGSFEQYRERVYNAKGALVLDTIDQGGDGTIDRRESWTYDNEDRLIHQAQDNNGDGNLEYEHTNTYDGDRWTTVRSYDNNSDGFTDRIVTTTYDENRNLTRYENDSDGDGTVDEIRIYEYDSDGKRSRTLTDRDGDGSPEQVYSYEYSPDGFRSRTTRDDNGDGVPDHIEHYHQNQHGYENLVETDSNGDGVINSIRRYTDFRAVGLSAILN